MKKLIFSFISIMVMAMVSFMGDVLLSQKIDHPWEWQMLLAIGTILFLLGSCLFALLAFRYKNRLLKIIRGMDWILSSKAARVQLLRPMPVEKQDEIGQLTRAFNELLEHFTNEYQELDKELAQAYHIQQMLLPSPRQQIGNVKICCFFQPMREVGGDLYDIIPIKDQRFAVAIGDVSGTGMPAALLMSVVVLLLRTEVAHGGSPGEILTRLNRHVFETMAGEMYVTLALAFLDERESLMEYACAGHVAPYLLREQRLEQIFSSTLPLGITLDEKYADQQLPMQKGDRFFMYTDGIVDTFIAEQEMLGFEGLEKHLLKLNPEHSADQQLAELMKQIGDNRLLDHEDDRTAFFLHWQ